MRATEHALAELDHEQYLAAGEGRQDEALNSGPAEPHAPAPTHG